MYKVKYALNYFNVEEELEYLYISVKESFFDGKSRYPLKPKFMKPIDSKEAFTLIINCLKKYNHFNNEEILILFDLVDKNIKDCKENDSTKLLIIEQFNTNGNNENIKIVNDLNSLLELVSTHFDNLPFDETDFIFYDKLVDLWYLDDNFNQYCKRELRKFTSISFTHEIIGIEENNDYPYC